MKTCISMWSLHKYWYAKELDVVGFCQWAATTGAGGVELLNIFWKDQAEELPRVREVLDRAGMAVAAYDATNNFVQADPAARAAQVARVKADIETAVALGATRVRLFSGDLAQGITFDQARQWIVESLRECAAHAAAHGVTLALENHGLLAGKSAQVLELIREVDSPAFRANIDTANFFLVDEHPNEAIPVLAGHAAHVHFKDFKPAPEGYEGPAYTALSGQRYVGTVAGEGAVDLVRAVADLKAGGYPGWLSVEFEGTEEPKQGTMASLRALQRVVEGANL